VSPKAAPEESTFIDVEFHKGVPVKITNKNNGTVKVCNLLRDLNCRF
jgi:argininosuccinate synthase